MFFEPEGTMRGDVKRVSVATSEGMSQDMLPSGEVGTKPPW